MYAQQALFIDFFFYIRQLFLKESVGFLFLRTQLCEGVDSLWDP